MIYAGCSGYSFKEWVGEFYPPKTPAKEFLSYYATQLTSVEINHTFRRFPRLEVIETWAEKTPESFKLSFKMHQSITHRYRLKNVAQSVSDFLDNLIPLGPRLGVLLFQLPPFFKLDLERLETFLQELPQGHRYAMEFRHDSWNEPAVVDRLKEAGVALCAAEFAIGASGNRAHGTVSLRATPQGSTLHGRRNRDGAHALEPSLERGRRHLPLRQTRRQRRRPRPSKTDDDLIP